MSESYDYRKTWVTEAEAQELHEILGLTLATVTHALEGRFPVPDEDMRHVRDGLRRAQEIAGNLVADICFPEDEEI